MGVEWGGKGDARRRHENAMAALAGATRGERRHPWWSGFTPGPPPRDRMMLSGRGDNERLGAHDPNLHRRATELWAKELGVPRRRVVRMLRQGVGLPQRHIDVARAGLTGRVSS